MRSAVDLVARSPLRPEDQVVAWNWRPWWTRWERADLPRRDALEELRGEAEDHGGIRRSFVYTKAGDPLALLISAMAWGYGRHPRAPGRMDRMLNPPGGDPEAVVREVVAATRSSVTEGFASLFSEGRPRLPFLGTSFGTKVLHFGGYERGVHPRPLIYDQFVWRAMQQISDAPSLPHPWRRVAARDYRSYCDWAERIAVACAREPVDVEYALFTEGRRQP